MEQIEYPEMAKGSPLIVKALYRTAIKGNVMSQLTLAEIYSEGVQVPQSRDLADKWYSIASLSEGNRYEMHSDLALSTINHHPDCPKVDRITVRHWTTMSSLHYPSPY
jgi:TPR repeat protein